MFTVFWNDIDDIYEPYSKINEILESSKNEFEILCHQDVRFLADFGCTELLDMLDLLPRNVSVIGIAGVTLDNRWYCCVQDETIWPEGDVSFSELKMGVTHVDECFICFSTKSKTFASRSLSGFHCYGTDVSLNALSLGHQTALIPFSLKHLSTGNFGEDFHRSLEEFSNGWSKRAVGYTQRDGYCVIAPSGWCRRFLRRKKVQSFLTRLWKKSIVFYPNIFVSDRLERLKLK
jgi:hypothetical protein